LDRFSGGCGQVDIVTDIKVLHGNCLDVLPTLPDCSVDSIVTDPPYGLEFMGKDWDAPWKGKASREFNEIKEGELGGFKKLPNHSRVNNLKCQNCDKWKFSSNPCKCDKPAFPNARLSAMVEYQLWFQQVAAECLRVLKPGGHLLAFGGTRTYHRMAVAIEDAGFEIRDSIHWITGSGFPKSLDVSKAIDKTNGETDRLVKFVQWMKTTGLKAKQINHIIGKADVGSHYLRLDQPAIPTAKLWALLRSHISEVPGWVDELVARIEAEREVIGSKDSTLLAVAPGEGRDRPPVELDITAPATDAAKQWQGWGTALKPAHEPIVVARKPLVGTVAGNVLQWGTGALNIDGTRVGTTDKPRQSNTEKSDCNQVAFGTGWQKSGETPAAGRWPANIVFTHNHDCGDLCTEGCPVKELDQQSGTSKSGKGVTVSSPTALGQGNGWNAHENRPVEFQNYADSGGASRFFTVTEWDAPFRYVAKPGKRERNAGLNHLDEKPSLSAVGMGMVTASNWGDPAQIVYERKTAHTNHHPTVKPLALMRWLVRLVTPPGGTVLEPFAGSGTTLVACHMEGFNAIGIEMTDEYLPIIEGRLEWARQQPPEPESDQQELPL
jgi:DNA modification methylase